MNERVGKPAHGRLWRRLRTSTILKCYLKSARIWWSY